MMDENKVEWILRIFIIVLLVITLIHYNIKDFSNCDKCKYEGFANGVDFLNKYTEDCLQIPRNMDLEEDIKKLDLLLDNSFVKP